MAREELPAILAKARIVRLARSNPHAGDWNGVDDLSALIIIILQAREQPQLLPCLGRPAGGRTRLPPAGGRPPPSARRHTRSPCVEAKHLNLPSKVQVRLRHMGDQTQPPSSQRTEAVWSWERSLGYETPRPRVGPSGRDQPCCARSSTLARDPADGGVPLRE